TLPPSGTTSTSSNWPPWHGCTGTTSSGCTATATTSPQQSSRPRSTLPNTPPPSGQKTNSTSLHQTQWGSRRLESQSCNIYWTLQYRCANLRRREWGWYGDAVAQVV